MRKITRLLGWLPDRLFMRAAYRLETGKRLGLAEPVTFGDKLNYLKLAMNGRHMARYVDKLAARKVAARALGSGSLMPLLGVWDDPSKIDWTRITRKAVLKCTHGSHCSVTYDPATAKPADRRAAVRKLRRWCGRNWYRYGREPPYRFIRPRIMAEEWSEDAARDDYKIMVMGGEPMVIQHHRKEGDRHVVDFYDRWGLRLTGVRRAGYPMSKRTCLDAYMAAQLARAARSVAALVKDDKGRLWPYVRIDLYYTAGTVKFGEITFFDGAGFGRYEPPEIENWLGRMIPIDGMSCPRCLAKLGYKVSCGEMGIGKIRDDTCPACGFTRRVELGVGS